MKYIYAMQDLARRLANTLAFVLVQISNVILLIIIVIGTVDVLGRYVFNSPIAGGSEMIEILLVCIFYYALPVVTYQSEHIKVALLEKKLPRIVRRFISTVISILFIVGMLLISNRLWDMAERYERRHSETSYLGVPMEYLTYSAIMGCYLVVFILILKCISGKGYSDAC